MRTQAELKEYVAKKKRDRPQPQTEGEGAGFWTSLDKKLDIEGEVRGEEDQTVSPPQYFEQEEARLERERSPSANGSGGLADDSNLPLFQQRKYLEKLKVETE